MTDQVNETEHKGPPWAITSRSRMVKQAKELVEIVTNKGMARDVAYIAGLADLIAHCFPEHASFIMTFAEICNISGGEAVEMLDGLEIVPDQKKPRTVHEWVDDLVARGTAAFLKPFTGGRK